MSALATVDAADLIPAPVLRYSSVAQARPSDRLAFRMPEPTLELTTDPDAIETPLVPVDLPNPAAWSRALVQTVVEVLLGQRPAAQLSRWMSLDLYSSLSQRAGAVRSGSDARRVTIVRVHAQLVDPGRAESSVVFHDGRRVRAAAVRIEVHRGRWRATALDIA